MKINIYVDMDGVQAVYGVGDTDEKMCWMLKVVAEMVEAA